MFSRCVLKVHVAGDVIGANFLIIPFWSKSPKSIVFQIFSTLVWHGSNKAMPNIFEICLLVPEILWGQMSTKVFFFNFGDFTADAKRCVFSCFSVNCPEYTTKVSFQSNMKLPRYGP